MLVVWLFRRNLDYLDASKSKSGLFQAFALFGMLLSYLLLTHHLLLPNISGHALPWKPRRLRGGHKENKAHQRNERTEPPSYSVRLYSLPITERKHTFPHLRCFQPHRLTRRRSPSHPFCCTSQKYLPSNPGTPTSNSSAILAPGNLVVL